MAALSLQLRGTTTDPLPATLTVRRIENGIRLEEVTPADRRVKIKLKEIV